MKNKKIIFIVAFMVITLSLGSIQAYAASNNTNLFNLIKQLFDSKGDQYSNVAGQDMDRINNTNKESILSELSNIDKEINALSEYEKRQVTEGESQVKQYTDTAKSDIKEGINQGKKSAEDKIKRKVDTKVSEGKAMIDAEVSKYINSK
ncbi:hypothetical protein EDD66_10171 [Mobilisporobacter senegalensis]|uniref:Uncharacterized protein n=1 Tax=Mobilisporobacter senegalensis TaxID=1329262 RepID=A0A3N1XXY2_9FIRM|nr:hypothetical protein [Mobilisporobacter senegalensis]ROR31455.1 hypothetical protein EDD66_10171 [Mobilisporobacter senegalensis]